MTNNSPDANTELPPSRPEATPPQIPDNGAIPSQINKYGGVAPQADDYNPPDSVDIRGKNYQITRTEVSPQASTDWLDNFISTWIRIEKKDAQYIKEAKLRAREEFKQTVQSYLDDVVLAGKIEQLKKIQKYWLELSIVVPRLQASPPQVREFIRQELADLQRQQKEQND